MFHYEYKTSGTCSQLIKLDLDDEYKEEFAQLIKQL